VINLLQLGPILVPTTSQIVPPLVTMSSTHELVTISYSNPNKS
jgi:hypothetical protein